MKQPTIWRSFAHAFAGLVYALRTQRNARIHAAAAIVVGALAGWLRVSTIELGVLALTVGLVFAGELFNTALEATVDLLSPEYHAQAKVAKDVAAGAVLVLSLAAVVVGLAILGPPLWRVVLS
jgi:diacylglycerol kinase